MVTLGGSAMSKSKGNIVSQDEIIEKYGADTARLFIMFAAPPEKQLDWSPDGVEGSWRFINRVWRLYDMIYGNLQAPVDTAAERSAVDRKLLRSMHLAIKKVTFDIEKEQQLNTAISSIMELVNDMYSYPFISESNNQTAQKAFEAVVLLLSPFVPHIADELWEILGHKQSVMVAAWPSYDEALIIEENIELPVQVNGKLRARITVPANVIGSRPAQHGRVRRKAETVS